MKVSEIVKQAISQTANDLGLYIVDVQYIKRYSDMHLIVYIDKPEGVSIDDCQNLSKSIDPILEDINPTNDAPYILDVSSYGIDKELINNYLLDKYLGKKVEIKLYQKIDKVKLFIGELLEYTSDSVKINYNNEPFVLEREKIATIFPNIEF